MELKLLLKTFGFFFCIILIAGKEIPLANTSIACGDDRPLIVSDEFGIVVSSYYSIFSHAVERNCAWVLKAPEGKILYLKTLYFRLNHFCDGGDALTLYEGEPPNLKRVGEYCGTWMIPTYRSKSNVLYLTFTSNKTPRTTGFQLFFKHVLPFAKCKDGEVLCRHRTACIPKIKTCDGIDDCGDGTDEENCNNIEKGNYQCGVPKVPPILENNKIVGGRDAVPGSWPWQASMRIIADEPYSHTCGGILIEQQWMLTAAHCFRDGNLDLRRWNVLFGKHFKLVPEDTEQIRYIEKAYLHPEYKGLENTREKQHDIALLKLNAPIKVTDYVIPICLPPINHTTAPGTLCYVTGYGATYNTGAELELKQAAVPIVPFETCKSVYNFEMFPSMICAGHDEGGHDSCEGDSGGPLVHSEDQKRWHLIGVVSTGAAICASKEQPGVYTSIPYYVDWIKNVTGLSFDTFNEQ